MTLKALSNSRFSLFKKLCLSTLITISCVPSSIAQEINLANGADNAPLELFADNGIEWQQNNQLIIAEGNAVAKRADVTLNADELRAYYHDAQSNDLNSNVYCLEALGHVEIKSPSETASGDKAVYDLERAILVLSGTRPQLKTITDTISADDTLEYWENKSQAVARGNAIAVRDGRQIKADILAALLRKDSAGKSEIYRVNAFGNVIIDTANEHITADRGVYNVSTSIATLSGSVKIKRGNNLLNGCSATVNLKTNISKLQACAGTNDNRVRGLVLP